MREYATAAICSVLPKGEAPKSIMIMPAGQFAFRDNREDCANSNPEAVIANTRALKMEVGIPIDYEHAIDIAAPEGRPAPAAGWISLASLRVQNGEIWGDVEWTESGAKAVAAGEWRYISPVFDFIKKGRVVTRILRAALTNNPALYDTAIAARAAQEDEEQMEHDEFRAKMAKLFGCEEKASADDIMAAAGKYSLKAKTAKKAGEKDDPDDDGDDDEKAASRLIASGKVVSTEQFQGVVTDLNTVKAERAREKATAKVDDAIRMGKLTPASRDWGIAACARDEKDFDAFIAKQPTMDLGRGTVRGTAAASTDGTVPASEVEIAVCRKSFTTVSAEQIAKNRGKGINLAFKSQFDKREVNLGKQE